MSIVKNKRISPKNSIITKLFEKIDYQDCYSMSVHNPHNFSIDYIAGLFFTSGPEWVNKLLTIRNFIVSFCGLKRGVIDKIKQLDPSVSYSKGSKIALFNVYERNDYEIVLAENDKHLNFRTSVMMEKRNNSDIINLYSSTIVHYNNIWGRLYFLPVRPFHQLIIKISMKILADRIKGK